MLALFFGVNNIFNLKKFFFFFFFHFLLYKKFKNSYFHPREKGVFA
jgi:hypothetical protein